MEFTVETDDLRKALRAVAPHASTDADHRRLYRVRLEVGPENVTVSATNGFSAGQALVSVWDNADGEIGMLDLSPLDVKELLVLFPGSRRPARPPTSRSASSSRASTWSSPTYRGCSPASSSRCRSTRSRRTSPTSPA